VNLVKFRVIGAVLAIAGMFVMLTPLPVDAELIGLVKNVVSDAYGTPPGTQREEKRPRFPVVHNELLETGAGSAILVEFLDKTTLSLGADAHLTIETYVYDPTSHKGTSVYKLSIGTLRFISGRMITKNVRIQTPSASIGLRGSDALIRVKLRFFQRLDEAGVNV
jgi:hypothetical protein